MMLTDRGWAALGAGLALGALWVGLGEIELLVAGLFLCLGSLVAWLYVRFYRYDATVNRRLAPVLVHEGDHARVRTAITNVGRWSVFNPTATDEIHRLGSARFVAGRIGRGETVHANYQIVCRPRGVYEVGPLELSISDPLRLATSRSEVGKTDRLTVYPRTEDLDDFPIVRGRDPSIHASRPEFSHRGGEDFFTLREYRTGDDLRRVHWPSSAKRDELMIKQLETPWQSRALVLLDTRQSSYATADDFEQAVRGAASVVRHLFNSGFDTELWTGSIPVSSRDPSPYSQAMELLAAADLQPNLDVRSVASRLSRDGTGGALIIVTGDPDADLRSTQQLLAEEYRTTILLSVASQPSPILIEFQRAGAVTIPVTAQDSWAVAWLEATRRTWSTASAG